MESFDLSFPLGSYDLQKASEWFDSLLKLIKSSLCFMTQEYLSSHDESAGIWIIVNISKLNSIQFDLILLFK